MRLPLGAFFFLFQRRLAEAAEPRRLAPGRISVSERSSVSNRANLVRHGSVSRSAAFSRGSRGSLNSVFSGLSSGLASRTRERKVGVRARSKAQCARPNAQKL